ncbi:phosphoenolpyruvate--protein phosphotransferase [Plantactinospora sp. CA-290183]|uniref:phosphoenolpyruvate--protein phosphotransferase n=1 Tax=Plantactinospora sp. CA-290183 TaxID=3240006 RepID=UPI003D8C0560
MSESPTIERTCPETELSGVGIGQVAEVGVVARMADPPPPPSAAASQEAADVERERARQALAAVAADLRDRAAQAGGDAAEVLEAQALMAEDFSLAAAVDEGAKAGRTAARAIFEAFAGYRDALAGGGEYLAARVADLDDIRNRAIAASLGLPPPGVPELSHPYVLVATDLAPADTATLDLSKVVALVTVEGGPTSHTAILARSRGIPAMVGCAGAARLRDGDQVLVDPAHDVVVLNPEPARVSAARAAAAAAVESTGAAGAGATADGKAVALLANIGGPDDVAGALAAGAEGVGLLRTEFLYLDAERAPSVEEQEGIYRRIFTDLGDRRVVVRVLDAGADKPLAFLPVGKEPNPALGLRGIRALRAYPDILHDQLAAIARAQSGTAATVWVMAPMVGEPAESEWFVAQAQQAGLATAGVMIEVPSAALLTEEILSSAAFVSLGTNDLAQYALAADRQLGTLAHLLDPWHPAVLRLIGISAGAAARAGKPIGVCGESAADPLLACVLVGLGVGSLSMAPTALGAVRATLGRYTYDECVRMADLARTAGSAAQARAVVREAADAL